jgi:hypothetical protein
MGKNLWFLQAKAKLTFKIKRDSHRHNHVNTHNGKSHMQIEWPFCSVHHNEVANITNGGVEVLETPCGDGV